MIREEFTAMNKKTAILLSLSVLLLAVAYLFWDRKRAGAPGDQLPGQPTEPVVVEGPRTMSQIDMPPVLRRLPDFSLTDQTGATFGSDELLGKAGIASFISTRDVTTMPALQAKLAEFEREFT